MVGAVVILFIPLVAGIAILNNPNRTQLSLMAGVLTLKPVFLTLIWMMLNSILITNTPQSTFYNTPETLSGIIVTVIITVVFRSLFFGYEVRRAAWLLLVLDALRWLPMYWVFTYGSSVVATYGLGIVSVIMPTVFAVIAWVISDKETERPPRKRKTADI